MVHKLGGNLQDPRPIQEADGGGGLVPAHEFKDLNRLPMAADEALFNQALVKEMLVRLGQLVGRVSASQVLVDDGVVPQPVPLLRRDPFRSGSVLGEPAGLVGVEAGEVGDRPTWGRGGSGRLWICSAPCCKAAPG